MSAVGPYERAVWSWHRHLSTGGSTTWRDWVATGAEPGAPPPDWSPPGAAQLEFLRRLAARGDLPDGALSTLADLVTTRSGPGRGLGQQPLSWPATSAPRPGASSGHRSGAPPVDPSEVPAEELVRIGSGLLTELLLRATEPTSEADPSRAARHWMHGVRGPFTRTPAFVLAGAPVTTSAVRRALAAAGHLEGGRSPRVVLLAEPFDYALAQVWSARVQRGAPVRWPGFVRRWSGRRELPPSADLPALARRWADRMGPAAVHLVVAPSGFEAATRGVAEVLGIHARPRRTPPPRLDGWQDLTPAAVDVTRRVNAVLAVRVSEDRHAAVLRRLVRLLGRQERSSSAIGHTLTVPAPARDWARTRADRMARELRAGGYPVHGSLDGVRPRFGALPSHPRREEALEVVLTACLGAARVDDRRTAPAVEGAVRRE